MKLSRCQTKIKTIWPFNRLLRHTASSSKDKFHLINRMHAIHIITHQNITQIIFGISLLSIIFITITIISPSPSIIIILHHYFEFPVDHLLCGCVEWSIESWHFEVDQKVLPKNVNCHQKWFNSFTSSIWVTDACISFTKWSTDVFHSFGSLSFVFSFLLNFPPSHSQSLKWTQSNGHPIGLNTLNLCPNGKSHEILTPSIKNYTWMQSILFFSL